MVFITMYEVTTLSILNRNCFKTEKWKNQKKAAVKIVSKIRKSFEMMIFQSNNVNDVKISVEADKK